MAGLFLFVASPTIVRLNGRVMRYMAGLFAEELPCPVSLFLLPSSP